MSSQFRALAVFWRGSHRLDLQLFLLSSVLVWLSVFIDLLFFYFGGTGPHFSRCTFEDHPDSQSNWQRRNRQRPSKYGHIFSGFCANCLLTHHFTGSRHPQFTNSLRICSPINSGGAMVRLALKVSLEVT